MFRISKVLRGATATGGAAREVLVLKGESCIPSMTCGSVRAEKWAVEWCTWPPVPVHRNPHPRQVPSCRLLSVCH